MPIPTALQDVAARARHPAATEIGITKTPDGRWALLVQVKKGTKVPLEALEGMAGGYPVLYEEEPDSLPVARPAYPSRGE
jgi:hypothetical protein